MITLTGKKVSEGIAIGKLSFYKRDIKEVKRIYVKDIEKEVQRFQKAKDKALTELKLLYNTSAREIGEANAAIFEIRCLNFTIYNIVVKINVKCGIKCSK